MKNLAYAIAFMFFVCGAHYLPAEAPNFILIYADDSGVCGHIRPDDG